MAHYKEDSFTSATLEPKFVIATLWANLDVNGDIKIKDWTLSVPDYILGDFQALPLGGLTGRAIALSSKQTEYHSRKGALTDSFSMSVKPR